MLDTNLLLLYAIGLYKREFIRKFKRTRDYELEDYDWLAGFLSRFRRVITTPHILAELSNHAIDRRGGPKPPYLPVLLEVVRNTKEVFIEKDAYVNARHLPRLGVTDSVIIELARRKHYFVITDDFALYGYLTQANCAVVNLNHIRSMRWRT